MVKKTFFGFDVIVKSFVKIEVIVGNVGKNSSGKMQTRNAVLRNCVRAYFHKNVAAVLFQHLRKQLVQCNGVRRRVRGRNNFIFDLILNRGKQAASVTQCTKKLKKERSDGSFTIGSRNTHQREFLGRMIRKTQLQSCPLPQQNPAT